MRLRIAGCISILVPLIFLSQLAWAQDASVVEVERVVSIEKPGVKAAAAKNDDPLAVRDILHTGLKSRATVRLNEREQLRVGQTTD